ncbi:DUF4013 domain-containing protein [Halosolutus halophilus]|uniref:DUF4013 domain-containing protein n=1 Tax=Halosolutus halophilus TaxID=1552990 RepID=UPI00223506EF|nr:DUF4013 domain-containing protein [Halosolutus halophilus]
MSYCRDCDETFERGTIRCPRCDSGLVDEESPSDSVDDWGGDDPANATEGWFGDDGGDSADNWFRDDDADSSRGWSGDDGTGSSSSRSGPDATDRRGVDDATGGGAATAAAHHEARESRGPKPTQQEPASAATTGPQFHDADLVSFSVTFPLGKSGKPLLIDTVMSMAYFLIVPMLFSYGYSFRVGRAAARGDSEPPSFDDWGGMAKDGGILFGIGLLGVVVFVVGLVAIGAVDEMMAGSPLAPAFDGVVVLGALAGTYFAGAIGPVLIGTGSLRETVGEFQFATFALTRHYLLGLVITAVVAVVGYVAFLVLLVALVFTIVGILLAIPLVVAFPVYLVNVLFAVWGYVYNRAAKAGDVDPVQPDDSLGIT